MILKPRVVLEANSQSGSQDLLVQEARSSWESQDAESYGDTRSNTADFRIPGRSISTVNLQDAPRQNNVTKLIEMFEKHQHKEQFLKDMSQKQEINTFSEESQNLLDYMNQTEIFELCENSAKHQCPDCSAFCEIGITWRKRSNLRDRYVQNISDANDKISNSKEEKLRLLCRSQNWMPVLQRATGKPAGSIFIFNFAVANFTMANELELMAAYII